MIPEKLEYKISSIYAVYPDNYKYKIMEGIQQETTAEIVRRYNGYADQQKLIEQLVEALEAISYDGGTMMFMDSHNTELRRQLESALDAAKKGDKND
jgi:hypothetical protein